MKLAIATMLKDEQDSLLEWFSHYISQGFNLFLVANNESSDGTQLILDNLYKQGLVRFISVQDPPDGRPQIHAFNKLLQLAAEIGVDVVGFLDSDEFLVTNNCNIKAADLIQDIFTSPDVGALAINWKNYGSSGHLFKKPGLVMERFTKCAKIDFHSNFHYKSFCRVEYSSNLINPHHVKLSEGRYVDVSLEDLSNDEKVGFGKSSNVLHVPLVINHYPVKSVQEFVENKMKRDNASTNHKIDKISYFMGYNQNVDESFIGILHAENTLSALEKLCADVPLLSKFKPTPWEDRFAPEHFFSHIDTPKELLINVTDPLTEFDITGWCISRRFGIPDVIVIADNKRFIVRASISRFDVVKHLFGKEATLVSDMVCGFSFKTKCMSNLSVGFAYGDNEVFLYKFSFKNLNEVIL
jgi:glycosyltransferase involved in cell wall biosynthesis